jgi:hypothetical protein
MIGCTEAPEGLVWSPTGYTQWGKESLFAC